MSEQKESSVLFSLKELMSLEEDRIRSEESEKAARQRAEEEARRQAELAARQAEESRLRAEDERRRAEEQRLREEAARLEAIRQAEIERARLDAEQQARMAAMAAQQQHERQLATITTDQQKKKLRNLLIGVVVGVLAIGIAATFVVYQNLEQKRKETELAQEEIRKAKEELDRLTKLQAEQDAKVKALEGNLASEKDEKKRLELQAQLAEAKKEAAETTKKAGALRGGGKGGDTGGAPKAPCNCKPTDPLCDCL